MNNEVRDTLRDVLRRYGAGLVDEPGRVEAFLRDLCGQHRREISTLVGAQKLRVPQELSTSAAGVPWEAVEARLVRKLLDEMAITEEVARWAVRAWGHALGRYNGLSVAPAAKAPPVAVVVPATPPSPWRWRTGVASATYAEWLAQARLPLHRAEAESAVTDRSLAAWLARIGDLPSAEAASKVLGLDDLLSAESTVPSSAAPAQGTPGSAPPPLEPPGSNSYDYWFGYWFLVGATTLTLDRLTLDGISCAVGGGASDAKQLMEIIGGGGVFCFGLFLWPIVGWVTRAVVVGFRWMTGRRRSLGLEACCGAMTVPLVWSITRVTSSWAFMADRLASPALWGVGMVAGHGVWGWLIGGVAGKWWGVTDYPGWRTPAVRNGLLSVGMVLLAANTYEGYRMGLKAQGYRSAVEGWVIETVTRLGGSIKRNDSEARRPITHINLSGTPVTDQDLTGIGSLESVEQLDLSRTAITYTGMRTALSRFPRLRILNLCRSRVSGGDVSGGDLLPLSLGTHDFLEELDLSHTPIVGKGFALSAAAFPRLRTLKLTGTKVTEEGLAQLRQQCPGLHVVR